MFHKIEHASEDTCAGHFVALIYIGKTSQRLHQSALIDLHRQGSAAFASVCWAPQRLHQSGSMDCSIRGKMAKMRPQMAKIRFKMRSKMAKMKHEVDDALWYPPRHGRNELQVGSKLSPDCI